MIVTNVRPGWYSTFVLVSMIQLLLLAPPALAGRDAELTRLSEEMTRLAQKTAWAGVERKYDEMTTLKRVVIPGRIHLLAAHAARERGDAAEASRRAELALQVEPTNEELVEEASRWIADFLVHYSPAAIELSVAFRGEPKLVALDGDGFDPKVRNALKVVNERLLAERAFEGFLPLGRYQIGDTLLEVYGGPLAKVFVKPVRNAPTEAAPEPVVEERPPDRILTLAVRGAGWQADSWVPRTNAIRDALYEVDGVMTVDAFQPDDPWVVATPNADRLADLELDMVSLAATLKLALDVDRLVVTDSSLAFPPGTLTAAALSAAIVGFEPVEDGAPRPVKLGSLAAIGQPPTGPFAMPGDPSAIAKHRFEVKIRGGSNALETLMPVLDQLEQARDLRITLEAQEVP